jgi:hypothetical protein
VQEILPKDLRNAMLLLWHVAAECRFAGELVNGGVLQVLNQLLQQELEGFGVQQKLLALSNTILQEVVTEEEAKRE